MINALGKIPAANAEVASKFGVAQAFTSSPETPSLTPKVDTDTLVESDKQREQESLAATSDALQTVVAMSALTMHLLVAPSFRECTRFLSSHSTKLEQAQV